LKEKETKETQE